MTGPARRLVATFALVLVTVLFSPVSTADADGGTTGATIEPVATGGAYSPLLNSQLSTFNRQLAELPTQKSLDDQQADLDRRTAAYNKQSKAVLAALDANDEKIRQHNAVVAQYPNGAPPSVADALNAKANAVNTEQQRLKRQAGKIADEGDAIKSAQRDLDDKKSKLTSKRSSLRTTRGHLVLQMATELLARLTAPPTTAGPPNGGDRTRPPVTAVRTDGGDQPSDAVRRGPLNRWADQHGVRIDARPVDAVLSPNALTKVSASNAGVLQPTRSFDGLVKQSDGTYRAVSLRDPSQPPTADQQVFDSTINAGGTAVVLVDGKKAVINGVDVVDAPTTAPAAPPQRHLALGLGGRVQPFAERNNFEHLMKFTRVQLRRELVGRLKDPSYRFHVSLKDLRDRPNTLARGRAYENGVRSLFDANGKMLAEAATWELAPSVTDWEMYLIHTLPGVLERTTFYDENDNAVADPF